MMVGADRVAKGLWWGKAWSLVDGCTAVSAGCAKCWARGMHERFRKKTFSNVTPREDRLLTPMRRGIPTVYAVWNDLFHERVPTNFADRAFKIMWLADHHRFVVLTKRAERMRDCLVQRNPLPNLAIGVSVENQKTAGERIPHLNWVPTACRMVSYEPVLGPVDFDGLGWWENSCGCLDLDSDVSQDNCTACGGTGVVQGIDWLIIGPETGPGRRPCELEWIRDATQQSKRVGIPVFIKALPIGKRISTNPAEWPEDLRLREFPEMMQ